MGFIYFPHGAVMNRWTPASEGAIFELGDILKPLEKYKAMTTVFSNIDSQAPSARSMPRRRARGCRACVRRSARSRTAASRSTRSPRAHRSGHAAAVARSRDGSPRRRRILRPRLRLQLRRHDLVPFADHAAADGDRSAQAVHPAVRSGRQRRGARAPVEAVRVAARHADGRGRDAAAQPGAVRQAGACPTIWRACAKSSAASRRWKSGTCRTSTSRTCRRARRLRSAPQPDVRHGRAGVSGEHDARLHLHDGGRGQQPDLQPHRRVRRVPSAVAPSERTGEAERLVKIQTYHSQAFAKFLAKLAAMPDGDGSMLDHSIFLYGSNMSNSNAHNH